MSKSPSTFVIGIVSAFILGSSAAQADSRQQRQRQQRPMTQHYKGGGQGQFVPGVIYTMRKPAKVAVDAVSWGIKKTTHSTRVDPTTVTVHGLPRGAQATLRVQERSHAIDLSGISRGGGSKQQQARQAKGPRFGTLRARVKAATNLRTVWTTGNAAPEIASGQVAETWQGNKVLPVNQPLRLDWSHEAKASGREKRTVRGHVRGLKPEYSHRAVSRHTNEVTEKSGRLANTYEGFIQRQNLLKTDAFSAGGKTLVKVKGVRALPAGAEFTVRNVTTGQTVSGKATRFGSFNARLPVLANAEQQLEISIRIKSEHGNETTMTRNLGKVTFAGKTTAGKRIGYHYVEPAGRALAALSANVKGRTVNVSNRAPLGRPEVEVTHKLVTGGAQSSVTFNNCKNQVVLGLGKVSADTRVEVLRQVPGTKDAKPSWQSLGKARVTKAPGNDGKHQVALDAAVVPHTPLKIIVKRPNERRTHVTRTTMPTWPGYPNKYPIGNFYGAQEVWRMKASTWVSPETVKRTVAYRAADGSSRVKVHGKLTAPAASKVTIFNESTGAASRAKPMREAFTTTLKAEPGHKLQLKIQHANGTVETKPLGIVPDAVEASYRPTTGLHYFPFTQNHIK